MRRRGELLTLLLDLREALFERRRAATRKNLAERLRKDADGTSLVAGLQHVTHLAR